MSRFLDLLLPFRITAISRDDGDFGDLFDQRLSAVGFLLFNFGDFGTFATFGNLLWISVYQR
jgi:hypothetical protein